MKKILVLATGGTIGAVSGDKIRLGNPLKILDLYDNDKVEFDSCAPFNIFSENIQTDFWQRLISYLSDVDFGSCSGVILLHGSDTLAWTGALLANIFYKHKIVLVAADKPLDNKDSNGIENFRCAVEHIINSSYGGVFLSFDGIFPAYAATSVNCADKIVQADVSFEPIESPSVHKRKILVISPYPGIDYDSYNIDGVYCVLHTMYHSATAPEQVLQFISRCKNNNVGFYFVTQRHSADYETASGFDSIIFGKTLENAYAGLILQK